MASPIKPLGDRVVAVQESSQSKTASGLFVPDTAKEKPVVAEVVAVGPKSTLKVGQKILYKQYSTTEVKLNNVDYLIISEEDIIATV